MENQAMLALKNFHEILSRMVEARSSDLHLKTGLPPVVRIQDELRVLSRKYQPLTFDAILEIAEAIIPERMKADLEGGKEIDLAYTLAGVGRFRLNIYRYRGNLGIAARHIPFEIRSLDALKMPPVVKRLAVQPRGLILVTGVTGSGKSTTVAACLNEWNQTRSGHIVTVEDPVEYVLQDKKSIISQREVGLDTESFAVGLKTALRQDPDVIMIGELRDKATIQAALNAAETGHLVISTLHTKDAVETVNRIIGVFEPEAQREVRMQFASALSAIISQRLLPRAPLEGEVSRGFVPAVEILVNTPFVKSCLFDVQKQDQLRQAMEQGFDIYGMQTFDQHLMMLVKSGQITREVALENATSPSDFELQLRGIRTSDGGKWDRTGSAPTAQKSEKISQPSSPERPAKFAPSKNPSVPTPPKPRASTLELEEDALKNRPSGSETVADLPGESLELDDIYKKN